MSATQTRLGASAANWRSTRSSQTRTPGTRIRRAAAPATDEAADAGLAHQALHGLAGNALAIGERQLGVNARTAVDLAVDPVDLTDALDQPLVLERPRAGRALGPSVIARTRHAEYPAQSADRVAGLLRIDEPEDHRRVLSSCAARKAAAFFKISRSSARIRFSRRSRRNSSRSSLLRPSRRPSSMSIWRAQLRSDCGETPSSRASPGTDLPLRLSSSTASRRNCKGYGAGMDTDPSRRTRRPSDQVSTKPGELQ